MIGRELVKAEIDKVDAPYLEALYKIIQALPTSAASRPVDMSPLPVELYQRQTLLMTQARQLRGRLGDPISGLATFLSALPPESDEFWLQVMETA
jgi:hypothetical protein